MISYWQEAKLYRDLDLICGMLLQHQRAEEESHRRQLLAEHLRVRRLALSQLAEARRSEKFSTWFSFVVGLIAGAAFLRAIQFGVRRPDQAPDQLRQDVKERGIFPQRRV